MLRQNITMHIHRWYCAWEFHKR